MKKRSIFDTKKETVIDTVEYNGRYTDVAAVRNKLITAGAIVFASVVFLAIQFLWF